MRGIRWEENASQIRNINTKVATSDIIEPMEDTVFHSVYASG